MSDLDLLIDTFFPLDWDKKAYSFNREEKDMHPYSVSQNDKATIITHNIVGIDKADLKISTEYVNGVAQIIITGKTKDSITGKEYSINSKFTLDENKLDLSKIKATVKNGLLYITIPNKIKKEEKIKKEIEIE
jgi:HSP20 family molecular chaperone IbpA